jgi:hypothetical protein
MADPDASLFFQPYNTRPGGFLQMGTIGVKAPNDSFAADPGKRQVKKIFQGWS